MGFATDCVHAGQQPEPNTGAVIVPVFQTSTYQQRAIGDHTGYEYARTQNPTREALEGNVAALEGGRFGVAFASGLAAISTLVETFDQGDEIICTRNVYGGTYRVFDSLYRRLGMQFRFVDTSDLAAVEAAWTDRTRLLFVETPTNPVLQITDIAAAAELARARGAKLCVDNTFMSPALQQPLALGADVVVHSMTKYLNGHSDMVGGILITDDEEMAEGLRFLQNAAGAVPGPWDCWLALRGTKTLHLRMRAHEENAHALLAAIREHRAIKRIYYPGLPDHPGHEIAKKQQKGYGGMISVDVGSLDNAQALVGQLRLFTLAESLGGVESLVCHPAVMTHAAVPREEREAIGVTDGLVRFSVGVEDAEDLVADVHRGLDAVVA
ncbi:MAG TPA: PLP-dependent aspartate aminotransferase family protein [Candidatus Krumholzibacteria bacterium]|nr:PLP-dependent aspartate aminotransferase family protein [Candidatus Krumholzibacteria bacterium]